MADIREADPAGIRFTQESIDLHFQHPFESLSIRDAVRKISNCEMNADDFKRIRVYVHNDIMWSVDNRRLWVFRRSKCEKIRIRVLKQQHWRFHEVLTHPGRYDRLKAENYFPGVRGPLDKKFDSLFPQPRRVLVVHTQTNAAKLATTVDVCGTESDYLRGSESLFLHGVENRCLYGTESRCLQPPTLESQQNAKKENMVPVDRSWQEKQISKARDGKQNAQESQAMEPKAWKRKDNMLESCQQQRRGAVDALESIQTVAEESQAMATLLVVLKKEETITDHSTPEIKIIDVHESEEDTKKECQASARATFVIIWRKVTGALTTINKGCIAAASTCSYIISRVHMCWTRRPGKRNEKNEDNMV